MQSSSQIFRCRINLPFVTTDGNKLFKILNISGLQNLHCMEQNIMGGDQDERSGHL